MDDDDIKKFQRHEFWQRFWATAFGLFAAIGVWIILLFILGWLSKIKF